MAKTMGKQERFKQAVEKFKNSKQTSQDYLDLIVVSRSVLAQGDGLVWSQIEDTLKEVVDKNTSDLTFLKGKIFTFSLPTKEDNNNHCKLIKHEGEFVDEVLKIEGCTEISGPNVCGLYIITFDLDNCPYSDNEIINKIDEIANKIGFED